MYLTFIQVGSTGADLVRLPQELVLDQPFSLNGKTVHLAQVGGRPIGLVATSLRDSGELETHFTITPTCRGQGFGKAMVSFFLDSLVQDKKNVVFPINQGNVAAESIAQSLYFASVLNSEKNTNSQKSSITVDWMLPSGGTA